MLDAAISLGMAVAGTDPDEMGIGPVFAIPRLLGLWEPNEASAVQLLYCQRPLGTLSKPGRNKK